MLRIKDLIPAAISPFCGTGVCNFRHDPSFCSTLPSAVRQGVRGGSCSVFGEAGRMVYHHIRLVPYHDSGDKSLPDPYVRLGRNTLLLAAMSYSALSTVEIPAAGSLVVVFLDGRPNHRNPSPSPPTHARKHCGSLATVDDNNPLGQFSCPCPDASLRRPGPV